MIWPNLVYFGGLLLTCGLSGYLAFYAWRQRQAPASLAYGRLVLAESLLALAEILAVLSPTAAQALFWFRVRYTTLALIAVFWLLFALVYSGRKEWLSKRLLLALFAIPAATQVMLWTNPLHNLWVKEEATLVRMGPFWIADISSRVPAVGFLTHSFYSLLLTLAGIVLLLLTAWRMRREWLGQALLLTGAAGIAFIFAVNSLTNLVTKPINPFTLGLGGSLLLIALAVYRFQFLRLAPPTTTESRHLRHLSGPGRRSLGLLLLIYALFVSGIAAGATSSYMNYSREFRAQWDDQLAAIADLKVNGLQDWRAERLGNAEVLHRNPAFAALVQACLENPNDTQAAATLQAWMNDVRAAYHYDRVFLLDTTGAARCTVAGQSEPVDPHLIKDVAPVLASGQVTLLDFHRNASGSAIHLGVLAPIYAAGDVRQPLGVVVLRIDPQVTLYPYLQQWPTLSETAETLLVRRDGDRVEFLNELRFRQGTALNLRLPLTQDDILAVKAVLGQSGPAEGTDYLGRAAVGHLRAVPDSPWFLVARVAATEVYDPLRVRLWQTALFFGVVAALCGAGLIFIWRQQRMRYYQGQLRTMEALRASEERFRLAFDTSPDSLTITRLADGMFISVNQGFEQISGYTRDEVIGKTSLEINIWKNPAERQWVIETLLTTGQVNNYEASFLTRSGEITGLMSAAIIHLNGGPHILNIVRDISDRKQAEEAIHQLNVTLERRVEERTRELTQAQDKLLQQERLAALGRLAGSVAHELRNPLGVISNAVYFLIHFRPQTDPVMAEYLAMIEDEAHTAAKVVAGLLEQTRIHEPARRSVRVADLLQRSLALCPQPANVRLTLDVPAELPPVYADPDQVEQVLSNLITNACQAMPEGGELVIRGVGEWGLGSRERETGGSGPSSAVVGHYVAISVRDTGVGIPPEHMTKLFEPLFSTKIKGIGLGLAVSKKLIEANEGWIEVSSEVGHGSTFTIYLPIAR